MRKSHAFAMLMGSAGVLFAALVGHGQERLGLAGRGDSLRLALLRTPEVQRELKLTDQQKEKIARIEAESKESKKRVDSTYGKGEKGKPKAKAEDPQTDEERIARQARESELDGLEQQADERLAAILDSRQRSRLTQIVLRVQGPSAFLTPEVSEKLGLTPDQIVAIREVLGGIKDEQDQYKEVQKRAFELAKAGGDFELEKVRKEQQKGQGRAFAYKLGKQAMPAIGRILTRRQRDLFNRMLGDPFDLGSLTGRDGQPLIDESADLKPWLLGQPPVQQELALTPSQRDQLAREVPASRVLDSKQRSRLSQLELQAEGITALTRPDVVRALRLDPEQVEQIQSHLEVLADESKRLRDALKAAPPEPGDGALDEAAAKEQSKARMRNGSAELRGDVSRRIGAVLTRRQNDQFRRLLGEPFDFSKLRPRPPGR
jgi:hypothetical protein